MTLPELAEHLRTLRGVRHKIDIQQAREMLPTVTDVRNGDDCAAIPDADGHLLFAIEGLIDEFVQAEPWFAGYCAVMVNVSDVYAMGGRPLALVDAIWTRSAQHADPIWQGMVEASKKYAVPIVGGHTNSRSGADHLAAAIIGRAGRRLLSSFDARSGDSLVVAMDLRGEWFGKYPYWNCSTTAAGERLRADLDVLPQLAEAGLCAAAKDISMAGLVGTATMLAEGSGVGMTIDVDAIPHPPGVAIEKWLSCFPSFGFVLAAPPAQAQKICDRFAARSIAAEIVGTFNDTRVVSLTDSHQSTARFWNLAEQPFIGLGAR